MTYRLVQVRLTGVGDVEEQLAAFDQVVDVWTVETKGEVATYSLLVRTEQVQTLTDRLQSLFSAENLRHIAVLPVEALLPRPADEEAEAPRAERASGVSREELYEDIASGATFSRQFAVLVAISAVVAAIGLVEDNIAVIIGAMVIAPLLGPNLALALATALGDVELMKRALATNAVGVGMTVALAIALGAIWPNLPDGRELLDRTAVSPADVVLAIASGAAAALSLASGLATNLVGVMVAVALMPPAVTFGMMVGGGHWPLAAGAALLLATNVVCVNLAANAVFWIRGIQPRTWSERRAARRAMLVFSAAWLLALAVVVALIVR